MARTAKRPKRAKPTAFDTLVHGGVGALGAFVSQNPALVGGTTAFLIAMSFVSANAIWYQPHAHTSPLFATRAFENFPAPQVRAPNDGTTILLERPATPVPSERPDATAPETVSSTNATGRDPAVEKVQSILKKLGYYQGEVDGISGRNTSAAISAYQRKLGLPDTGQVDDKLLSELGAGDITGSIAPAAKPVAAKPDAAGPSVERIQAGLKAFGNKSIKVDGQIGQNTRDAIKEFQALFGLAETGEPDAAVYEKMLQEGFLR